MHIVICVYFIVKHQQLLRSVQTESSERLILLIFIFKLVRIGLIISNSFPTFLNASSSKFHNENPFFMLDMDV